MSDKRTIYAIGAIVAAFALILGTVAGSTSFTTMSVSNQTPMQMSGHAIITLADADGNIKAYRQTDNVVTNNGRDCIADELFGSIGGDLCDDPLSGADYTFIGIGTGLGLIALDEGNTVLGGEILTRTGLLDSQSDATTSTGAIKTIKGVFTLTDTETVNEVGLFDAANVAESNMFSRLAISPVISGGALDIITITYIVTVG